MWSLYTASRSPLSQPPKQLMAIGSSSDFPHLRPMVFHISLRKHKRQPRGRNKREQTNKQTNKHELGLAPSARREKFVTLLRSFLCICGLAWACIRVKFPLRHQEYWPILSRWPTQPLSPQVLAVTCSLLLTSVDCSLLSTALFCPLPWSVLCPGLIRVLAFCRPLLLSWEITCASPLVGFAPKETKGSSDRHSFTPSPTQRMPNIVSQWEEFLVPFNPQIRPYQVLPFWAKVDLENMPIKGYSAFPTAPALEPYHQIVLCHNRDTYRRIFTPPQKCTRCIL